MLTTIAIILLVLWLLGVVGVYSIGWFVHILLVAAIILFLIRVINGENPLKS
jgi:asparagine N-glycosylation enzyme membrane subunit Stt3